MSPTVAERADVNGLDQVIAGESGGHNGGDEHIHPIDARLDEVRQRRAHGVSLVDLQAKPQNCGSGVDLDRLSDEANLERRIASAGAAKPRKPRRAERALAPGPDTRHPGPSCTGRSRSSRSRSSRRCFHRFWLAHPGSLESTAIDMVSKVPSATRSVQLCARTDSVSQMQQRLRPARICVAIPSVLRVAGPLKGLVARRCLPLANSSQLTAHSSQLAAHSSQLTAHSSQLTARSSQLTARSSQLAAHSSQACLLILGTSRGLVPAAARRCFDGSTASIG